MKVCVDCGIEKANREFRKTDGVYRNQCRECLAAARRALYARKKEAAVVRTGSNPFEWRTFKQPVEVRL